jgi:hypothetical protein
VLTNIGMSLPTYNNDDEKSELVCKPFKELRIDSQLGGIGSLESISGLLECFKYGLLNLQCFRMESMSQELTIPQRILFLTTN